MGEFLSITYDGLAWDCANAFGLNLFMLGVLQGGRVLGPKGIKAESFKSSYRAFTEKLMTLDKEEFSSKNDAIKISSMLKRELNLRLDHRGISEVAEYLGFDFMCPDPESYGSMIPENCTHDFTEAFLIHTCQFSQPGDFSRLIGEAIYTEYIPVEKRNKNGNLRNDCFVCPACGTLNSKCDPEVFTCGKCLSVNVEISIDITELSRYDESLYPISAYDHDLTINGPLANLTIQNYLDGGLLKLSKLSSELINQDVLRFVKARSRLQVKNQHVCSSLTDEEVFSLRYHFKNLEIIKRKTWNDTYGMLGSESHCLLASLLTKRSRIGVVKGFNPSFVNSQKHELIFGRPTHLLNWSETGLPDILGAQVFNYNSIPEVGHLIRAATKDEIFVIVPNILDQYNGFGSSNAFEVSTERGITTILFNGSNKVIVRPIKDYMTLLCNDYIKVGDKVFSVDRLDKASTCTLVRIKRVTRIEKMDVAVGSKSVESNNFKCVTLNLPDWQQNVKGLQFGPLLKRRIRFNVKFLRHLVSRCEAWPVSFHGLREYAIISSFSRIERDDKVNLLFSVPFEDIPDHVFCAYNLYLRKQLSTQVASLLTNERTMGLEHIVQALAGGIGNVLINLVDSQVLDTNYAKCLINDNETVNWLLSSQWAVVEESIKEWEVGKIQVVELDNTEIGLEYMVPDACEHGSEMNPIGHGCPCCGQPTDLAGRYCSKCSVDSPCEHKCLHQCRSKRDHFCSGILINGSVSEGTKMPCGHKAVTCNCCRVISCYPTCQNCFNWADYDNEMDNLVKVQIKVQEGEAPGMAVNRIISQARSEDVSGYQDGEENGDEKKVADSNLDGKAFPVLKSNRRKGRKNRDDYKQKVFKPRLVTAEARNNDEKEKKNKGDLIPEQKPDEGKTTDCRAEVELASQATDEANIKLLEMKVFNQISASSSSQAASESSQSDEDEKSEEEANEEENIAEKFKLMIMIDKLRSATDDSYTELILNSGKAPRLEVRAATSTLSYIHQGEVAVNLTNIRAVNGINADYEGGYCLRDSFAYYNAEINEVSWRDACDDLNLPATWCLYTEISKYAQYFSMNVLVVHQARDELLSANMWISDPNQDVNFIRYITEMPTEETYELNGHYQPCELTMSGCVSCVPCYTIDVTRDDVDMIYANVTGRGDINKFMDLTLEQRVAIGLAINENKGVGLFKVGFPNIEYETKPRGFFLCNNANKENNPRGGKLAIFIPDVNVGPSFHIPNLQTEFELTEWVLKNQLDSEYLSDELGIAKDRINMAVGQYLQLKLQVESLASGDKKFVQQIANRIKNIKFHKRKNYWFVITNPQLEKLKTGDVVLIRQGPSYYCCQVLRHLRKLIFPVIDDSGFNFQSEMVTFKTSYASLLIELDSAAKPGMPMHRLKQIMADSVAISGYPGTGKTRRLIQMSQLEPGVIIGVTRGSQNSLRAEAMGAKVRIISAERALTERANSSCVYIDEGTLLTVQRILSMLGPNVKKLVVSGDPSQIPAKEYSPICAYEPTNLLEFARNNGAEVVSLLETWRFGPRVCGILNEAFGTDLKSVKPNDTPFHLEHSDGLNKKELNSIIEKRRIDTVLVFTTAVERQVNALLGPENRVRVARVHSSQGDSRDRVLIVQDYRKGPAQSSLEVQFKREYMIVAVTRCVKEVTLMCTYETCKHRESSNTNIARHLNRELEVQYLASGGASETSILNQIIGGLSDQFNAELKSLEPSFMKDWASVIIGYVNGKINNAKYSHIAELVRTKNVGKLHDNLVQAGFPLITEVSTEDGKIYATMDYEQTDWNPLKKMFMMNFSRKQEILVKDNKIYLGGIMILSKANENLIEVEAGDFDAWKYTKNEGCLFYIKNFHEVVNEGECQTINMNVRLLNHSAQLTWNAAKAPLVIDYAGKKYYVKPTTGCSLCGGLEIRTKKNKLIVFVNNAYRTWTSRSLQYKSENNKLVRLLIGKWDKQYNDGHLWEILCPLIPNVKHHMLHAMLWGERVLSGLRGLLRGKTVNPVEGHLFRNELEFNERVLIRYKNEAARRGITLIWKNDPSLAYFRCSSFLFSANQKGKEGYVYFEKHSNPVFVKEGWVKNNQYKLVLELWRNELYRFPYNLAKITGPSDIKVEGYGELSRMLELDLEKHGKSNSKLISMLDEDLTRQAKDRLFANPEIQIPCDFLEDARDLMIHHKYILAPDLQSFCCGISYLLDSVAVKQYCANVTVKSKGFVTRFPNLSLRLDVERYTRILIPENLGSQRMYDNLIEDCFARLEVKIKVLQDMIPAENSREAKMAGRGKNGKDRYSEPRAIAGVIQNMINRRDLATLVDGLGNCTEIGSLAFGVSALELSFEELRKIKTNNTNDSLLMMIPDFRNENIKVKTAVQGNRLVFKGEVVDYEINPDWCELVSRLINAKRWETVECPDGLECVGQEDLFLVFTVCDKPQDIVRKLPVNMRNDESICSVPQLNSITEMKRTKSLFRLAEFSLDTELLGRLVRRAMIPGCSLETLQTIARNRMHSTTISKLGRKSSNKDPTTDASLCALVAMNLANHHDNQITRYMEKIEDFLLDNKDWKRANAALIHTIKMEMNTILGKVLNLRISIKELSEVAGNCLYTVLTDDNNLRALPRLTIKEQPHRIMYGQFFHHKLDVKNPDGFNFGPNIANKVLTNTVKAVLKMANEVKEGYWVKKENNTFSSTLYGKIQEGTEVKVVLHRYDLAGGLWDVLSKRLEISSRNSMITHSSVRIGNLEVSYGNGIKVTEVGKQSNGLQHSEILIGTVRISEEILRDIDESGKRIFVPKKYSPIGINCNLFSLWLLIKLGFLWKIRVDRQSSEQLGDVASLVPEFGSNVPRIILDTFLDNNSKILKDSEIVRRIEDCLRYTMETSRPVGNSELFCFIITQLTILTGLEEERLFRNIEEMRESMKMVEGGIAASTRASVIERDGNESDLCAVNVAGDPVENERKFRALEIADGPFFLVEQSKMKQFNAAYQNQDEDEITGLTVIYPVMEKLTDMAKMDEQKDDVKHVARSIILGLICQLVSGLSVSEFAAALEGINNEKIARKVKRIAVKITCGDKPATTVQTEPADDADKDPEDGDGDVKGKDSGKIGKMIDESNKENPNTAMDKSTGGLDQNGDESEKHKECRKSERVSHQSEEKKSGQRMANEKEAERKVTCQAPQETAEDGEAHKGMSFKLARYNGSETVSQLIKDVIESRDLNRNEFTVELATNTLVKYFLEAGVDPTINTISNLTESAIQDVMALADKLTSDFVFGIDDINRLMANKVRFNMYNSRSKVSGGNKLRGIKVGILAVGSFGDTLPVIRAAQILKNQGAWVALVTHADSPGLDGANIDKFYPINKSQEFTTGNIHNVGPTRKLDHALSHNEEAVAPVIKALKEHEFDVFLSTPLCPAATAHLVNKGIPTADFFCTYCWQVPESAMDLPLGEGVMTAVKDKVVDWVFSHGYPIAKQTVAELVLQNFNLESADISNTPRLVLSWSFLHSQQARDDNLCLFLGYTSPCEKLNAFEVARKKLKILVGFGSMSVNLDIANKVIEILRTMDPKLFQLTLHSQYEHKTRALRSSLVANGFKFKELTGYQNTGQMAVNHHVMICHGGIGTVQECLKATCIPIIVPVFADQPYVANNISERKFGIWYKGDPSSLLASVKKISEYQKRVIDLKLDTKTVENNLVDSILDLCVATPDKETDAKSKEVGNLAHEGKTVPINPYLIRNVLELPCPDPTNQLPGEYECSLKIEEGLIEKIGESYTGDDCLMEAMKQGITKTQQASGRARLVHSLSLFHITRISELGKLFAMAYYNRVNLQVLGFKNRTTIFDSRWPLVSIFIVPVNNKTGLNNLHAYLVNPIIQLSKKINRKNTNEDAANNEDVTNLGKIIGLPIGINPMGLLESLVTAKNLLVEWDWAAYGSYENFESRLHGTNIDSLLESDTGLIMPVDKANPIQNGVTIETRIDYQSKIGEIVFLGTEEGLIPTMITNAKNGKVYLYTGRETKPLGLAFRARLIRSKKERISKRMLQDNVMEGKVCSLNKETINKLRETSPGLNLELVTEDLINSCPEIKILATSFDTRGHHSERSEMERAIIIKHAGTQKLKTLPVDLGEGLVRAIKYSKIAYFNYQNGHTWFNIETASKDVTMFLSKIVTKMSSEKGGFFNQGTSFRLDVTNMRDVDSLVRLFNNHFKLAGHKIEFFKDENYCKEGIMTVRKDDIVKKTVTFDSSVLDQLILDWFEGEEEIPACAIHDLNEHDWILDTVKYGICLDSTRTKLLVITPLIALSKILLKGAGFVDEANPTGGDGSRVNINAKDLVMDQPSEAVIGPQFGKDNFGRFDKWLQANKHLKEIDNSVNNKAKVELTRKKFVWEEIYGCLQADGQLQVDADISTKNYRIAEDLDFQAEMGFAPARRSTSDVGNIEDHRIIDLWEEGLDLIDHVVIHCPTNEQKYVIREGNYSIINTVKTIFSKYPVQCRPIFHDETYASLNSLTGRLGRGLSIRSMLARPKTHEVIDKIALYFFDLRWKELTNTFQSNPIMYNEKDFLDWVSKHKNPGKVIKELEKMSAEGILLNPFNQFRSHVKLESINKNNPVMDFRQSAPRAIVWLPYFMPAIFSYMFKMASDRFKLLLRNNVHYTSGVDVIDLSKIVNEVDTGFYLFDNDISKMDSQIDEDMVRVEWEVLRLLGIDAEVMEVYKLLKNNWRISNKFLSVRGDWLRHSGEPTTALGNGIINLAITSLVLENTCRSNIKLCLFVGDDLIIANEVSEDLQMIKRKGRELANAILKPNQSRTNGPFCSFIIGASETSDRLCVVPNVPRLAYKWEVPNGQHETTEDAVFTRQLSYSCILGSNEFSKRVEKLIKDKLGGELQVPSYYDGSEMIQLNCKYHKLEEMEVVECLNTLYQRIEKPTTRQVTALITSENIRKGVKSMSRIKELTGDSDQFEHRRLIDD
ncbi:polyprotein [Phaseolus vulgaris endornavirus 3]|uniref:Polyprotein n=2 Tax=Phaseolus vulgaris endornavirus 3 TaxID=2268393 RepID=A0A2Z5FJD2_9VIRU|nr:polyprotein [Phaseolus vulgaris endornavirus 3]AXB99512.1 polyprotein [Phaseolus vulgaris endornavirus 3]